MSDSSAIAIENLSKCFLIRQGYRERYIALRDVITRKVRHLFLKTLGYAGEDTEASGFEEFWALKDLTLNIAQGERIGIIGRNGAGKSTLLKILSRITEPSAGRIVLQGRVASLLEVGTGFHPELTGRENIFLNGAILGMTRGEIQRKFDDIVDFADIHRFLDTPVKYFSSGMYMRLAFSVAAHLETEILLVDEVLAVGDYHFQKKCLGKMEEIGRAGRTILFVSHDMGAIRRLCTKGAYLKNGTLQEFGPIHTVIEKYYGAIRREANNQHLLDEAVRRIQPGQEFELSDIRVTQDGVVPPFFVGSKSVDIEFRFRLVEPKRGFFINIEIWDTDGNRLAETFDLNADSAGETAAGIYLARATIPAGCLLPIAYELKMDFGVLGQKNYIDRPISFMLEIQSDGVTNMVGGLRPLRGKFALPFQWQTTREPA